jgi:hypothetical protein
MTTYLILTLRERLARGFGGIGNLTAFLVSTKLIYTTPASPPLLEEEGILVGWGCRTILPHNAGQAAFCGTGSP